MQVVLELLYRWRYGERREADRSAVRDDPSGRWLQSMAEPTVATSPVPLTPGAIVTTDWSYQYGGNRFTESGEWVHLPAGEAGNLLLWIRSVEENTQ